MPRALIVRKALISGWIISSTLIFFVAALVFGSLLCMVVTDMARPELSKIPSSQSSR